MKIVAALFAALFSTMCGASFSVEDSIDCSRSATEAERRIEACNRQIDAIGPGGATLAWRGEAKEALGDLSGAQRDYEESLALAPELGGTLLGLGRVHLAQGDLASARRYLDRAIAENDSGIARDLLGSYALRQHDYPQALSWYEELLAREVDDPIGLYGRGLARLGMGDDDGREDIALARAEWDRVDAHFGSHGLAAP